VLLKAGHVVFAVVTAKDPAENVGMEGLQTAVHHFRKSGVRRDVFARNAVRFEESAGSARTVDLDAHFCETFRKNVQIGLIADADDRAFDFR